MLKHKHILPFLVMGLLFVVCKPAYAFVDSNSHWARLQIDHLNSRGFLNGYPDGSFQPDASVSREEFVTVLIKAIHKESQAVQLAKGETAFKDMQGRWSVGYVALSQELNIAQGNGQGLFQPANSISREEAVTMLINCLKANTNEPVEVQFPDSQDISSWAQQSVAYAVKNGLIHGYPDGTFRPRGRITRAEVACILEELLALQGDEYNFYGTLKSVDQQSKQIVSEVNSNEVRFTLAANARAYNQEGQPIKDIPFPVDAYFDLDASGKLTFIRLDSNPPPGQVVINQLSLPDYEDMYKNSSIQTYSLNENQQEGSQNIINTDPGSSLQNTRDAMKVWNFEQATGASGRGQLIAVIDSGVDPGHPDLQYTNDKFNKIIDFVDLTEEGKVDLNQTAQIENGYIQINGQKIYLNGVKTVGGLVRYGYLKTNRLPLNTAAVYPNGQILVVSWRSRYIDLYDRIYVDLNGNGEVSDESVIQKFSDQHQILSIPGSGNKIFNFVLAEIDKDGKFVKLGYDAEGHGTMVAGIAAANGKIVGVAKDAQILPIKIINSVGTATLNNLKTALQLAGQRGAKIAVVSMGQADLNESERQALSDLAADLWEKYGMAICIAAGNDGPGLNTVAGTSVLNNLISVGAYVTPEMLQNDFGWTIKEPLLWYFSAAGPSKDGQAAPLVVAPGSAISCYPMWADYPYQLDQGSSMAAPHVAGAAALLMDAVSHKLYRSDARAVWMALLGGAEPLTGYQSAEQGYGAINLMQAWSQIKNLVDDPLYYQLKEYSPEYGYGLGYYSRSLEPGKLSVTIKNPNSANSQLAIGSMASWFTPEQLSVQIPAKSERSIELTFNDLTEPGLYSGFLLADDVKTPGWDVAMLQTVVVPYKLSSLEGKRFEEQNSLDAGRVKRYYFQVPQGTTKLDLLLKIEKVGRARLHIIAPDGSQKTSSYAGVGDPQTAGQCGMIYNNPMPGTWEVVVYSSITLSALGMDHSEYTFSAALENNNAETMDMAYKYLITTVPKQFKVGEKTYISLHLFNTSNMTPVNDVITIQGRVYEVKDGLVQLEITPETDSPILNIAY